MKDERERWLNVAQAAQWLAEGRDVQWRPAGVRDQYEWLPETGFESLSNVYEYRLKPEPREWVLFEHSGTTVAYPRKAGMNLKGIRVREVLE